MPFGHRCEFTDFDACVSTMSGHVDDPRAYCGALMRDTEAHCKALTKAQAPLALDFAAVNQEAVTWAEAHAAQLVDAPDAVKARIRALITRSIEKGIPPKQLARMIRDVIGLNEQQADAVEHFRERLATTGVAEAVIERRAGRYAEAQHTLRANTIARTECLIGETLVDTAVIGTVYRRWYDGDVVEVSTSAGRKFTTTPNHPMFTNRGWVAAGKIHEGDYMVCDERQQDSRSSGDPDVVTPPATIAEIFDAASTIGICERRASAQPDFHGDGMDGEVDIASPFWILTIGMFSPLFQPLLEQFFAPSDLANTPCCLLCGRLLPVNSSIDCLHGSQGNVVLSQDAHDDASADAKRFSDVVQGFASSVALTHVIDRQIVSLCGVHTAAREEEPSRLGQRSHWQFCPFDDIPNSRGIDIQLRCNLASTHVGRHVQVENTLMVDSIPQDGGFGSRARLDISLAKPIEYAGLSRIDDAGDFVSRQSSDVELDCVCSTVYRKWAGHVYNLSTPDGYFTVNGGIYTGNTIRALNKGQRLLWDHAIEKGVIQKEEFRKIWIVTDDERLCVEICEPNGEQDPVGIDEAFDSGDEEPPGHPSCRCAVSLVSAKDA